MLEYIRVGLNKEDVLMKSREISSMEEKPLSYHCPVTTKYLRACYLHFFQMLFGKEETVPSEGCSNPQSTIARNNSGFKMKSLKLDV
mmetsp:Transcript_24817/g.27130  ORF Transcript_24817/g.27130 Transcript_24817/m.27130 type:complete len:87 (-) Transcript_24817:154-414(-)